MTDFNFQKPLSTYVMLGDSFFASTANFLAPFYDDDPDYNGKNLFKDPTPRGAMVFNMTTRIPEEYYAVTYDGGSPGVGTPNGSLSNTHPTINKPGLYWADDNVGPDASLYLELREHHPSETEVHFLKLATGTSTLNDYMVSGYGVVSMTTGSTTSTVTLNGPMAGARQTSRPFDVVFTGLAAAGITGGLVDGVTYSAVNSGDSQFIVTAPSTVTGTYTSGATVAIEGGQWNKDASDLFTALTDERDYLFGYLGDGGYYADVKGVFCSIGYNDAAQDIYVSQSAFQAEIEKFVIDLRSAFTTSSCCAPLPIYFLLPRTNPAEDSPELTDRLNDVRAAIESAATADSRVTAVDPDQLDQAERITTYCPHEQDGTHISYRGYINAGLLLGNAHTGEPTPTVSGAATGISP